MAAQLICASCPGSPYCGLAAFVMKGRAFMTISATRLVKAGKPATDAWQKYSPTVEGAIRWVRFWAFEMTWKIRTNYKK
jgi:hypothetical protein